MSFVPLAEFYWLLKVSTPPIANTFAYIAPIIAVFLGWTILDESVTYLSSNVPFPTHARF